MRRKHPDFVRGSRNPLYNAWLGMNQRCHLENHTSYQYYGAKGITVCDEWRASFNQFVIDMGPKPDGDMTLDRIKNNLGYSPSNCRWVSMSTNRKNRPPSKPYDQISNAELATIRSMRESGARIADIATTLGRSATTITSNLKKMGIELDLRKKR